MDLIVIPKIFNSTTRSNPINVFNIMDRYSRWIRQEGMECEVFVEQFLREVSMKYPLLKDLCNKTSTQKTLSGIIRKKHFIKDNVVDSDQMDNAIQSMIEYIESENKGFILKKIKENQLWTLPDYEFVEGDTFGIVIDRDQKSFTEEQVKIIRKRTGSQGYKVFLSNPCFELWILMHFPHDKDKVINFAENTDGLFSYLSKVYPNYEKNIDFTHFNGSLDKALLNEWCYCTSLETLYSELNGDNKWDVLGSNVGEIFELLGYKL